MRASLPVLLICATTLLVAAPASAQRLPFERTFDATNDVVIDVSTMRGKIDIVGGEQGRVVIAGTVTVRTGFNLPWDAVAIARRVAEHPPVSQTGNTIELRPPVEDDARRSVTVAYQMRVPSGARVLAVSDSGAITVASVQGTTSVTTQSGAIALRSLSGATDITSGSGAVLAESMTGGLSVKTSSSAITARKLAGRVTVRTNSGAVDTVFAGAGDVDIETGSSAIRVLGLSGGLKAASRSGSVTIGGMPTKPWDVETGSGSVDVVTAASSFNVEAVTRSGSVKLTGAAPIGGATKRNVTGTVGAGGPQVRVTSRSGSIHVAVEAGKAPLILTSRQP